VDGPRFWLLDDARVPSAAATSDVTFTHVTEFARASRRRRAEAVVSSESAVARFRALPASDARDSFVARGDRLLLQSSAAAPEPGDVIVAARAQNGTEYAPDGVIVTNVDLDAGTFRLSRPVDENNAGEMMHYEFARAPGVGSLLALLPSATVSSRIPLRFATVLPRTGVDATFALAGAYRGGEIEYVELLTAAQRAELDRYLAGNCGDDRARRAADDLRARLQAHDFDPHAPIEYGARLSYSSRDDTRLAPDSTEQYDVCVGDTVVGVGAVTAILDDDAVAISFDSDAAPVSDEHATVRVQRTLARFLAFNCAQIEEAESDDEGEELAAPVHAARSISAYLQRNGRWKIINPRGASVRAGDRLRSDALPVALEQLGASALRRGFLGSVDPQNLHSNSTPTDGAVTVTRVHDDDGSFDIDVTASSELTGVPIEFRRAPRIPDVRRQPPQPKQSQPQPKQQPPQTGPSVVQPGVCTKFIITTLSVLHEFCRRVAARVDAGDGDRQQRTTVVVVDEAHIALSSSEGAQSQSFTAFLQSARPSHVWLLSGTFAPNDSEQLETSAQLIGIERFSQERDLLHRDLEQDEFRARMPEIQRRVVVVARPPGEPRSYRDGFALRAMVVQTQSSGDVVVAVPSGALYLDVGADVEVVGVGRFSVVSSEVGATATQLALRISRGTAAAAAMSNGDVVLLRALRTPAPRAGAIDRELQSTMYRAQPLADRFGEVYRPELASGVAMLVFFRHKITRDVLALQLRRMNVRFAVMDGDQSGEQRLAVDAAFRRCETQVLLISYLVGGVGLNFQRAHRVVIAELSWNFAPILQAERRAWRIGQKRSVQVDYLVVDGSFDGVLIKKIEEKLKQNNTRNSLGRYEISLSADDRAQLAAVDTLRTIEITATLSRASRILTAVSTKLQIGDRVVAVGDVVLEDSHDTRVERYEHETATLTRAIDWEVSEALPEIRRNVIVTIARDEMRAAPAPSRQGASAKRRNPDDVDTIIGILRNVTADEAAAALAKSNGEIDAAIRLLQDDANKKSARR